MQKISNLNALDQGSLFAVVKSIPDGLIIMDEKGAPLYFNRSARQLLSLKEQKASLHQYLLRILDFDPLSVAGEEKIKTRVDGTFYQVLICPFQSRYLQRGIILFFKDISVLLEAEEMKTEFISIASHELRNPITAVNNALEILSSKETGEINPAQESFLRIALRNMHRIAALVEEYLDLSRIEVGRQIFQYSTVNLDDFLQPLVEECKAIVDHTRTKPKLKRLAFGAKYYMPRAQLINSRSWKGELPEPACPAIPGQTRTRGLATPKPREGGSSSHS